MCEHYGVVLLICSPIDAMEIIVASCMRDIALFGNWCVIDLYDYIPMSDFTVHFYYNKIQECQFTL